MDTKDLKAFVAVYQYKSINQAAQALFMTPQGLSQTIKKLERELDLELFSRTPKGVFPTKYGDVLNEKSGQIIKELTSLKKTTQMKASERLTPLTIASTFGVIAYLTVDFLIDFREAYPDIQLDIIEAPDDSTEEKIWTEKAELGFLAGPINTVKFNATFFTSHKHCLVIHKEHRLAQKRAIAYEDLENEPIALEGRAFRPYHNNMNRFLKAGVTPQILLETSEIEFTHQIASANKGIGLSVDYCAFNNPHKNTVIRPFKDFDECTWDTYLITKKGKVISKEAEIFQDFALSWLRTNQAKLFKWDGEVF
ncbi:MULTISPECIES: LysR family transcriptional regulator [unclassified Paenibacillus]|uniref:LysR family transcriptional regulator n=1 Tax=unclassified Paenibacillus TaxID=185978 RepID=UPI0024061EE7|nr:MULTISPECIES: LysR family transcriptional regulator [unclassified Paenibacillus]MDF9839517.1 DNA-binding transcriptional LysR family regulator [Paenibacillus sp. PastF-2]MDF9846098.1 DNA-binding transcriptional LysR family regulator [Paenibacillus sp. PastM-2]MDF9852671.1 DNA-binding transcriptional LysR family regulator [Paenibacillus sp. PastF-1]MDH6477598.1 DNA-binding transcriptional LysR family regulator [Paenibacillus sp. PastH-2]MDH6505341.1 DNA-binding transcriptional LysR family re